MIEFNVDPNFLVKVFWAVLCGAVIGFERQHRGRTIGMRTSILICLGTLLFIYLGDSLGSVEGLARVLAQVVTGVGFLGAGVIMNKEGSVRGITSAAIVWLLAAVGSAIGLEEYGVAITVTLISIIVLVGIPNLERIIQRAQKRASKQKNNTG